MKGVNVREYGARGDGTTDDVAAFQAAHDYLPATGGVIRVPPSTAPYLLTKAWLINKSRVEIVLEAGAHLKSATGQGVDVIDVFGTATSPSTTTTTDPAANAIQLAVSTASGFASGDWIEIQDAQVPTPPISGAQTHLELNRIKSIVGNTLNLYYPTQSSYVTYATAPTVTKINVVEGVRIVGGGKLENSNSDGTAGQHGINTQYCWDLEIHGIEAFNVRNTMIQVNKSQGVLIEGCYLHDAPRFDGSGGYGVATISSSGISVIGCKIFRVRHAVDFSTFSTNVVAANNVCRTSAASMLVTHPDVRNAAFIGNLIDDAYGYDSAGTELGTASKAAGISIRDSCRDILIANNVLQNCINAGVFIITGSNEETLSNPSFSSISSWETAGSNWSIASGAATCNGAGGGSGDLKQLTTSFAFEGRPNESYSFRYTVLTSPGGGTFKLTSAFAGSDVVLASTVGTHQVNFTTGGTVGDFVLNFSGSSGTLSIDNLCLNGSETILNGSFASGTGWVTLDDWVVASGGATWTFSVGSGLLTQSKTQFVSPALRSHGYGLRYTVRTNSTSGGSLKLTSAFGGMEIPLPTAVGDQVVRFTTTDTVGNFELSFSASSGVFTIDNVSLIPLNLTEQVHIVNNVLRNINTANGIDVAAIQIHETNSCGTNMQGYVVRGNVIDSPQRLGIWCGISDAIVADNVITGADDATGVVGSGIRVHPGTDVAAADVSRVIVRNNICRGNRQYGIRIGRTGITAKTKSIIVDGNQCAANRLSGILLEEAPGTSLTGNQAYNNGQNTADSNRYGIQIQSNSDSCLVRDNSLYDDQSPQHTQLYGLRIASASCVIGRNTFSGNATGDISNSGTGTLYEEQKLRRVAVVDANYTVLSTDYIVAYTTLSTTRTVTLPAASLGSSTKPFVLQVRDESGSAAAGVKITVAGSGGATVNGAASKDITSPYGSMTLYSNGTNWFAQ